MRIARRHKLNVMRTRCNQTGHFRMYNLLACYLLDNKRASFIAFQITVVAYVLPPPAKIRIYNRNQFISKILE